MRAVPAPPPTPAPTPPPGPTAGPTCGVEVVSRSGGTSNLRVFGGGFAGGDTLVVTDNGAGTPTVANGLGGYSVLVGVLKTTPPVPHRFQTSSTTTAATSNEVSIDL